MEKFNYDDAVRVVEELVKSGRLELPGPRSKDPYDPDEKAREMARIHAEYFRTLLGELTHPVSARK